jgi:hypothetical protein
MKGRTQRDPEAVSQRSHAPQAGQLSRPELEPSRAVVILRPFRRSTHAAIVVVFVPKVRKQFLAHGGVAAPAHQVTDPVSATVSPPFRVPGAREEPSPRPLEAHQPSRGVVAPAYSAELAIRSLQPRHNDPVGRARPILQNRSPLGAPTYLEVRSGNFGSNNCCKISTTETLWYEVGHASPDVLGALHGGRSVQEHLPRA